MSQITFHDVPGADPVLIIDGQDVASQAAVRTTAGELTLPESD